MMSRVSLLATIVCLFSIGFADPASATEIEEIGKLTASDADEGDKFGYSVSLDGDVALVGAWGNSDAGTSSGAAYVYRFDGAAWVEEQKLTASDAAMRASFGYSVALDGDVALIGALTDSAAGPSAGAAYVFRFDGTSWVEEQKLTASDAAAADLAGAAVSVSGDVAVIGAWGDDDAGSLTGSAYVFRFDGSAWTEEQKLTASGGAEDDRFGFAVSVNGDVAVIGAIFDDEAATDSGAAYVFRFDGTTWVQEQVLTAGDAAEGDQFGTSASLGEGVAVIGALLGDGSVADSGAVYVYRFDGTTWVQEQEVAASDGAANDWFGVSVSLSGDALLVGASRDEDHGTSSGSAYVYYFDGTSWVVEQKLNAGDAAAGDAFGESVALSGSAALVGARGDEDAGSQSGSAYAFSGSRCFYGTVNAAAGPVTDVLFVNGSPGSTDRTVEISEGAMDLFLVTMMKPSAGGNGKFVLHGNEGEPTLQTPVLLPFDIGTSCFPFLLSGGATPVIVANNIGKTNKVGESQFFGGPWDDPDRATTDILFPNLPTGTVLTLQGVIIDPASVSPKSASATNAVIVEFVP